MCSGGFVADDDDTVIESIPTPIIVDIEHTNGYWNAKSAGFSPRKSYRKRKDKDALIESCSNDKLTHFFRFPPK